MTAGSQTVIARYSVLKVLAWVGSVAALGAGFGVAEVIFTTYRVPARHASDYPMMSLLAFVCLVGAVGVALGVAITGGVAIVATDGAFIIRHPFSRQRVAFDEVTKVQAILHLDGKPAHVRNYQPPSTIERLVTLWRRDQGELKIRVGFMKDSAETIAARMNTIIER